MGEILNTALEYLNNPAIRFTAIGVGSLGFGGVWMLLNKPGKFKYDTVTDLKKKAKSFTRVNYQQPTNNKSKSGF